MKNSCETWYGFKDKKFVKSINLLLQTFNLNVQIFWFCFFVVKVGITQHKTHYRDLSLCLSYRLHGFTGFIQKKLDHFMLVILVWCTPHGKTKHKIGFKRFNFIIRIYSYVLWLAFAHFIEGVDIGEGLSKRGQFINTCWGAYANSLNTK